MQSYGKRMQERELDRIIREKTRTEMLTYAKHYDLCMLMTLHREFGFGAARLEKFYRAFEKVFVDYQARYYDDDDFKVFGSRSDEYRLEEDLMAIGLDYEALVASMKEVKGREESDT